MWYSKDWKDYELIDCGRGEKLERWGKYTLVRPDPQAIWATPAPTGAGTGRTPAMPAPAPGAANGPARRCPSGGRSVTGT